MTSPRYEYAVETATANHVKGWCRRASDLQPAEIAFKVGDLILFTVAANKPTDDGRCGFSVSIDKAMWRVCDSIDVCTPAGDIMATVDRPLVRLKARDDAPIEHEFGHSSPVSILGRFRLEDGDDMPAHHAKVFGGGKLLAYLTATPKESGWLHYEFLPKVGSRLLDKFAFVVIDDSHAFLTNTHLPIKTDADNSVWVLPLPVDIADVVSLETDGVDYPTQVVLYGLREYLGVGDGCALVYDRDGRFGCRFVLNDGSEIKVTASPDRLSVGHVENQSGS